MYKIALVKECFMAANPNDARFFLTLCNYLKKNSINYEVIEKPEIDYNGQTYDINMEQFGVVDHSKDNLMKAFDEIVNLFSGEFEKLFLYRFYFDVYDEATNLGQYTLQYIKIDKLSEPASLPENQPIEDIIEESLDDELPEEISEETTEDLIQEDIPEPEIPEEFPEEEILEVPEELPIDEDYAQSDNISEIPSEPEESYPAEIEAVIPEVELTEPDLSDYESIPVEQIESETNNLNSEYKDEKAKFLNEKTIEKTEFSERVNDMDIYTKKDDICTFNDKNLDQDFFNNLQNDLDYLIKLLDKNINAEVSEVLSKAIMIVIKNKLGK